MNEIISCKMSFISGGDKCQYYNCGNLRRTSGVRLFRFPFKRNQVCEKWILNCDIGRARSTLSVSDVEYYLHLPVSCPTSPAASTLTLTPGKIRNIDQDMENLRVSRQDNPFIQRIIASRESLLESSLEEESDNATLMSKELLSLDLDVDPLSMPEMHEHMIRSPPPTNWPRSPNFRAFEFPCDKEDTLQVEVNQAKEKSKSTEIKPKHSSWSDGSESSLKSFKAHYYHDKFSLLSSSSLRPSAEDSIRLMGED